MHRMFARCARRMAIMAEPSVLADVRLRDLFCCQGSRCKGQSPPSGQTDRNSGMGKVDGSSLFCRGDGGGWGGGPTTTRHLEISQSLSPIGMARVQRHSLHSIASEDTNSTEQKSRTEHAQAYEEQSLGSGIPHSTVFDLHSLHDAHASACV